jgi:hypothetical protein
MNDLITDQTVLAMLPIVTLGVIVGVLGLYSARKERRASRERQANHNR